MFGSLRFVSIRVGNGEGVAVITRSIASNLPLGIVVGEK